MATEIIMPQMGESIAEGTITKWLAKVGESIERDQPLLEISTDKVDAEIPSPATGVLLEVRFNEGDTVEVDTVIGMIGAADEAGAAAAGAASAGPQTAAGVSVSPVETEEIELPGPALSPESPVPADSPPLRGPERQEEQSLPERVRSASSPVVRKIAEEHNVDISRIEGTGIHGRVTKQDILSFLEGAGASESGDSSQPTATDAPQEASAAAASSQLVTREETVESRSLGSADASARSSQDLSFSVPAFGPGERVEIEPMDRVRKLTAAHMLYSRRTSAHVATVFEIDMSNVVAARNRVKSQFQERVGTKLTFMPFIFKAVTDGLQSHPKFNASVDGTDIVYKKDINLGMAVASDFGLLVPVIRNADQLNLVGLARTANDLADRVRTKKLSPDELQRGTFTVTNPGVFGSLYGIPIINQPQVAILCVGTIQKRPVVLTDGDGNDSIAIRTMCHFCLSYDHRLIDGADAEQFMNRMKRTLVESSWDELDSFR